MTYNVSPYDLQNERLKKLRQIDYMSSRTFVTSNGSIKTLLDVNMSANISTRYYAQLVNKVNTLQQVMTNENLIPVFLNMTLDGPYHDLLYGDYSNFTLFHQRKLPQNSINGFFREKASKREAFTENDLYQVLRYQLTSFQKTNTYQKMRENYKIGYLFATEPHKSGVPHAHGLLYIPFSHIQDIKKEFEKCFWAPQNKAKDPLKLTSAQIENGEMNGFQWSINNPVGYVLKYVTKSFMDIKNQSEMDELQAWYSKNRIGRFTMSHTLVPQWVYNKIYPLESDWLYLSDLKLNASCEWSQEDDYFKFEDTKNQKVLKYERGLYQYFQDGNLVHEFGQIREPRVINIMRQEDRPITSLRPRPLPYPITINNIVFHSFTRSSLERKLKHKKKGFPIFVIYPNGLTINMSKVSASKINSRDLLELYYSFNLETCDLKHFGVIKNECIKRNLLSGVILPINEFSTNIENPTLINPYEAQFEKARTFLTCRDVITSFIAVNNSILEIGA